MKTAFLCVIYLLFSSLGQILFKYGSNKQFYFKIVSQGIQFGINLYAIIGLIMYLISFILFMFVISKYNLSYIIPILTGVMYILTLLFSVTILKEVITIKHIIGSLLILSGVMFIILSNK